VRSAPANPLATPLARHLLPLAAALLLTSAPLASLARGRVGVDLVLAWPIWASPWGGYGEVGVVLPGPAVTVQLGGVHYRHHHGQWYRPWGLRWVMVVPPPGLAPPPAAAPEPTLPTEPAKPDPVIHPRQGQNAEQTEADRRDCNRWATTQPAALADAAVFQRTVLACMDGRGYTVQ
jgi:hypothetical protein